MDREPIHDDVFGELSYDPALEDWSAVVSTPSGGTIEVGIWWIEEDHGPFNPVLERAREAFRRFREHELSHREALAAAMVERYCRSARQPDHLLETGTLARGLRPTRIAFWPDGSAQIDYDDASELFGDHSIVAELDADGTFDGFTLQG